MVAGANTGLWTGPWTRLDHGPDYGLKYGLNSRLQQARTGQDEARIILQQPATHFQGAGRACFTLVIILVAPHKWGGGGGGGQGGEDPSVPGHSK